VLLSASAHTSASASAPIPACGHVSSSAPRPRSSLLPS
jgi:hypothetical protein